MTDNLIKEEPTTLAEWHATLDAARLEIRRLRSELAHIRFIIGGNSGTSEDCDEAALRENAERALTRLRALGVTLREMRLP